MAPTCVISGRETDAGNGVHTDIGFVTAEAFPTYQEAVNFVAAEAIPGALSAGVFRKRVRELLKNPPHGSQTTGSR